MPGCSVLSYAGFSCTLLYCLCRLEGLSLSGKRFVFLTQKIQSCGGNAWWWVYRQFVVQIYVYQQQASLVPQQALLVEAVPQRTRAGVLPNRSGAMLAQRFRDEQNNASL